MHAHFFRMFSDFALFPCNMTCMHGTDDPLPNVKIAIRIIIMIDCKIFHHELFIVLASMYMKVYFYSNDSFLLSNRNIDSLLNIIFP